jgi:ATP-binding cassette subfamily D (ALD) long-chain fatty acid import protein
MAWQSKLTLSKDRSLRGIIAHLTGLYVKHRTRISRAIWISLFVALANRIRHAISEQKAASAREAAQRAARQATVTAGTEETPRKKVALNREFFRSLMRLSKIVVPGWRSKEARMLASHSFFLVLRTLISVRVAEMDGAIVKALVKGNGKEFLKHIVWWMLIAVPATFTNSMVMKCLFLACFAIGTRAN